MSQEPEQENPALANAVSGRRIAAVWDLFAQTYMDPRLKADELEFFKLVFFGGACVTLDAFKRGTPEQIADMQAELEAFERQQQEHAAAANDPANAPPQGSC